MKINLENPQTKLDHAVWWVMFCTFGWILWIVIVVGLSVAYWHDKRLMMKSLERDFGKE